MEAVSPIHNLRKRHAVVTGTPITRCKFITNDDLERIVKTRSWRLILSYCPRIRLKILRNITKNLRKISSSIAEFRTGPWKHREMFKAMQTAPHEKFALSECD
jgi:hypothetical protein